MRFSLIALAVATLGVLPPGGTFIDDDDSTHEGSIEAVAAAGITRGCNPPGNNRYCPDEAVTRGQMAAFLTRALELTGVDIDHFTDDDRHTFENDIDSLAAAGITRGCGDGRFCPDRSMTRGEMAAMLARAMAHEPSQADHFVDDDGHLFEESIDILAQAGVTRGCNPPDNDRFCPDQPVTRAEMATFLTRAIGLEPNDPPDRPHPVVEVASRESWGAVPAETELMELHDPVRMTVHHAGTQTGTTGPAQFRSWQGWHMSGQGWGDIAYHLIIGIDGTVYEGRDPAFEGDTGTTYDTTGHFLVVVEGYFDEERPTAAQVESLERVLAWASEEFQISPSTISGHRDHAATTCPGTHLHAIIESGELQRAVAGLIDAGGIEVDWP
jgi:hypothetical protein